MSVAGIGAVGFTAFVPPTVGTTSPTTTVDAALARGAMGTAATTGTAATGFGDLLGQGLDQLGALNTAADRLAVRAATGDLTNLHDYTIAATEASVATQLTVAVRNKAIEAFNEIMRMQV